MQEDSMGKVCTVPMHISWFQQQGKRVKQCALGEAHTLVLDHNGFCYAFGWSDLGQLGT